MEDLNQDLSSLVNAVGSQVEGLPDVVLDGQHDELDALDEGNSVDIDAAASALNALASAWSTFRLYPDPGNQPAFVQSLKILEGLQPPLSLAVGTGTFSAGGHDLAANRAGVDQLAKQLFIHDIDEVRIVEVPSSHDLCEIFKALALEPDEAVLQGGIRDIVGDITTILLRQRGLLGDDEAEEGGEDYEVGSKPRTNDLAALVDEGATPAVVAEYLAQSADEDPIEMTRMFVEAYEEIHEELVEASGAPSGTELEEMFVPYWADELGPSPTGTFVDVFFRLPGEARTLIMANFLDSASEGVHRMFLDQFSGNELAAVASQLDETRFLALIAYAKEAADVDLSDRNELLSLLESGPDVRLARREAASNIAALLAAGESEIGAGDLVEEIRAQIDPEHYTQHGRDVVRGLFEVEDRDDRFTRLLRIWTGRISRQAREGDYDAAMATLRSVTDDPPHPPERGASVQAALGRLVTRSLLKDVLQRMDRDDPSATEFLAAIGSASVKKLVEHLADEEDASNRRALIELLTVIGRNNIAALLPSLRDPRWYVVRNVVTVLGKTGGKSAVAPLKKVAAHEDPRVRVEVLRALIPLTPGQSARLLIEALGDRESRVRQAAATLLKTSPSEDLDALMLGALDSGQLDEEMVEKVAEALCERRTDEGIAGLKEIANRRMALKKQQRVARNAARVALQRGSP